MAYRQPLQSIFNTNISDYVLDDQYLDNVNDNEYSDEDSNNDSNNKYNNRYSFKLTDDNNEDEYHKYNNDDDTCGDDDKDDDEEEEEDDIDYFRNFKINKNNEDDYNIMQSKNKDILNVLSPPLASTTIIKNNKKNENKNEPMPSFINLNELYKKKSENESLRIKQLYQGNDDSDSSDDEEDIYSPDDNTNGLKRQRESSNDDINSIIDYNNGHKKKKRRKEETFDNEDSCFLCACGDRFHDGIRLEHINKLNEIMDSFYGITSNEELAIQLHLYFTKEIYKKGMPMLEVHVALRHIEEHIISAKVFIGESIRKWRKIQNLLEDTLFTEDCNPITKNIIIYERIQKIIMSLYNSNIAKMNFNNGNTKEDLNKISGYHKLMPTFTKNKEKRERLENKKESIQIGSNTFVG